MAYVYQGEFLPHTAGLENLRIVMSEAYPDQNGDFNSNWRDNIPEDKSFLKALDDGRWNGGIDNMLSKGMGDANVNRLSEIDTRAATIDLLYDCLRNSKYKLKCPMEQMREVSRDYLYFKSLRNMTNHANGTKNRDQKLVMDSLSKVRTKCGASRYKDPERVGMEDLKDTLRASVQRLRDMNKGGKR